MKEKLNYMQALMSDMVKWAAQLKDDIIKESLSEYHGLPLTEETYKRITIAISEDEPGTEYYFLDSADVTQFNDYDWSKLICKFSIPEPTLEDVASDSYRMTMFIAHTPVKNSKFSK